MYLPPEYMLPDGTHGDMIHSFTMIVYMEAGFIPLTVMEVTDTTAVRGGLRGTGTEDTTEDTAMDTEMVMPMGTIMVTTQDTMPVEDIPMTTGIGEVIKMGAPAMPELPIIILPETLLGTPVQAGIQDPPEEH